MIIGVDASRAFQKQKTGIEWYVCHLINELATLDTLDNYRLYTHLNSQEDAFLATKDRLRVLHWPLKRFWTQGRLSLEMLLHPPDVLVIPASAMPLIRPKKTIVVVHDVGFLEHAAYRSWFDMWYLRFTTHHALRHAWRIIAVSEFTKQEILKHYTCPSDRIRVIPIGTDQALYQPLSKSAISEVCVRLGISQPFFLSIGRIDPRKNIMTLLEAFSSFAKNYPTWTLVIAGPKGYRSEHIIDSIQCAQQRGISIIYCEWISEEDKRTLLHACAAFIFPSFYEGFGIPIVEAQQCGALVVASSIPALEETSGGEALFFDPHHPHELTALMGTIAAGLTTASAIQERGTEQTRRFSWRITAEQIDAVCHEV